MVNSFNWKLYLRIVENDHVTNDSIDLDQNDESGDQFYVQNLEDHNFEVEHSVVLVNEEHGTFSKDVMEQENFGDAQ